MGKSYHLKLRVNAVRRECVLQYLMVMSGRKLDVVHGPA